MVAPLNRDERIFLAGCIKSMLLADGTIESHELAELEVLITTLRFTDFEECLTRFEESVKDEESFWEMAKSVVRPDSQRIILDALNQIMLHEGIPEKTQENLISRLKESWAR